MGQAIQPRVIRSGAYVPTLPRTGDTDGVIFRKMNLITRGRGRLLYEQAFSGLGDLDEPLDVVALTGTLAFNADLPTITGTGTAFLTECRLGQTIIAIGTGESWSLIPKQILSNTSMVVWKSPADTRSGVTGYRQSVLWAINNQRGTSLGGNAEKLDKGSFVSTGQGVMRVDGDPLQGSSLTMTSAPQLSLYDPVTGNYTNAPLGMPTSAPPTLAAVGGGTKGMQAGNYSMVITPAHKETGGYNNPSERADVTIATGDMVATLFPAMDGASLQSAWIVWVTDYTDTLGADLNYLNGPWHRLRMVTDDEVSPAGGTVNLEWLDAEVENNEIVSFNNDAPTDAYFVASMNSQLIYVSCQGPGTAASPEGTCPGPFIVPSKPNNIDAAPLSLAFSSSPPETILGVVSANGRLYLLTVNKLQIAQSTPSDTVPIIIRPFWHDGFANPYQLVFVNGTLYGFPVAGPSRSIGDGDEIEAERNWAEDVAEIILGDRSTGSGWNPGQVLVGYDPFNDAVVFFHAADRLNEAGFWTTRWLMFGISQNNWIGDGEFTDDTKDQIVSGVATVADRMDIVIGGRVSSTTGATTTEQFDNGDGSAWWIVPSISDSGEMLRDKNVKPVTVIGQLNNSSFKVYAWGPNDEMDVAAIEAGTGASTNSQSLPQSTSPTRSARVPINVPNAMLHTIRLEGDCREADKLDEIHQISYELAIQGCRR